VKVKSTQFIYGLEARRVLAHASLKRNLNKEGDHMEKGTLIARV